MSVFVKQWLDLDSLPIKISFGTSLARDSVPTVGTYSAHCSDFLLCRDLQGL